ncbi:testis-expressed protein 10 homolog [Solenopsis invicta]|uniref:testis-expressed protein 10 homolog n=1 Tax=Solenopsis invicta TaxID=13686 RepID=UPI000E33EC9B|nr:testis-expressed protein 10 homolog [Solenopsis invicta]XP_039315314.1 testis-expressed protein 10 homolog [Solenopsis invicta]
MSKNHKRSKHLKSEKSKVKLKTKKSIDRPAKGLNATDTSFKVKKILIREQLKQRDETEIVSTRKLNIDDLLTLFRHHNSTVREDALKQLKDILFRHPPKSLHSRLNSLLHGIAALSLDKEKGVRTSCFHALNVILGRISNEQLMPLCEIVMSYLSCAMTHIDPCVKQDSLLFLDVLLQNCGSIVAKNSHKILLNFLGMICRLHNEVRPEAQLTTTLNSKSTNINWRIKVLERLANLFISVVNYRTLCTNTRSNMVLPRSKRYTRYVPIYSNCATRLYEINLEDMSSLDSRAKETVPLEEFVKYIGLLIPLMCNIWLEVCPKDEKVDNYTEITILSDGATLLRSIVIIIQSIAEYIDTLDHDDCDVENVKHWFKETFHDSYMKNFLSRFPYTEVKPHINKFRKRQKDFSQMEFTEGCLEQNLGLCQIHAWFTSLFSRNEQFSKSTKMCCVSVMKYLNGVVENWCDSSVSSQLTKLLRTLFLKAGTIWYTNSISLNHTLRLIIEAASRLAKKELQSHFYLIIGDIMLQSDLNELHRERAFENFVASLPSLLLKPSIDDVVIRMISHIVVRFKEWIREELVAKHESIIDNANKIDIVGSHDDKQSRLMICNLFYFIDSHVYY